MKSFTLLKSYTNKYILTSDSKMLISVGELAINFNIKDDEIIEILLNEFNCLFKDDHLSGDCLYHSFNLCPYFENEEDGLKAIDWLNSLSVMNKIADKEDNSVIDIDFDVTKSYLNEIQYYIQTKFGGRS